jgi:transposase
MRKKHENREQILARLRQPGSPSVNVMAEETGIPAATLYAWVAREKHSRASVQSHAGAIGMNKRSKHRTPSTKLRLIAESLPLEGDALLSYCTTHGVTVEELLSWRDLALSGIEVAERDGKGRTRKELDDEFKRLEEDLRRKNEALAEAAALLVLQKKTSDLLSGIK